MTDGATLRIALADKVHNTRSIVRDYRTEGHALWDRFTKQEIARPTPCDDEMLVRARATTVNRTDCGFRQPRQFLCA